MVPSKVRVRAVSIWAAGVLLFANSVLFVPSLHAENLPLDLSLISDEHVGFVQVRLADLWRSASFAQVRQLVAKAGPEMLKVFDQRFVPAPSTVDRLTVILAVNPRDPQAFPEPIIVVATSKAFDRAKLLKGLLPEGVEAKAGDRTYFVDAARETALRIFDASTFALGPTAAVTQLTAKPRGQAGKLQPAVDLAAGGQSLVAVIKPESILPALLGRTPVPPQLAAIGEAQTLLVSARLIGDAHIDVKMEFADARKAKEGEQGVRFAISLAQQQLQTARAEMEALVRGQEDGQVGSAEQLPKAAAGLLGLGAIELADEQLAKILIVRRGEAVTLAIDLPQGPSGTVLAWGGFSAGLFLPAVQKVRESGNRIRSQNNLKQMALAMHNYYDVGQRFPAAAICAKDGKPLLSWRVAMLPYVEQADLYNKFHLDEPWDSKHNRELLSQMPAIYVLPGVGKPGDTKTHYQVFVGTQAMFEMDKGRRIAEITDGTSNTWMIAEAAQAVPWTKPEDLVYDPEKPVPKLGRFFSDGFHVAFVDGSVHFFKGTLPEATIRALITPAGGEVIQIPPEPR